MTRCVKRCQLSMARDHCLGCGRTLEEIVQDGIAHQRAMGLPIAGEPVQDSGTTEDT